MTVRSVGFLKLVVLVSFLGFHPLIAAAQACPSLLDYLGGFSFYQSDFLLDGEFALVSGQNDGLFIVDVGNPEDISLFASFDYAPRDVDICGEYWCLLEEDAITVIDHSNPSALEVVASYDFDETEGKAWTMAVIDDSTMVTNNLIDGDYDLLVFDLKPTLGFRTKIENCGSGLIDGVEGAIFTTRWIAGTTRSNLKIISTDFKSTCNDVSTFERHGSPYQAERMGDLLFYMGKYDGVLVIDISDPVAPVVTDSIDAGGTLVAGDGWVGIGVSSDRTEMYFVNSPTDVKFMGFSDDYGSGKGQIRNGILYRAGGSFQTLILQPCTGLDFPDCNFDGLYDAGDLSCIIRKIFEIN